MDLRFARNEGPFFFTFQNVRAFPIFFKFGPMTNNSKIATFAKNAAFRLLRIAGALLLIYVSMVFYLALTERRNAFPRAITHKEANAAIEKTATPLTCTLDDGTALGGFSLGNNADPTLLYFPEADEDAAQFLAQVENIPGINIVTFNYRGSASNKGTPSEENFVSDARQILECATQVNGNRPQTLAGRGTGAILAAELAYKGAVLVFIDPIFDIADAISQKYRYLYPKFLVRTSTKADLNKLSSSENPIYVIYDKKSAETASRGAAASLSNKNEISRDGRNISTIILQVINKNLYQ